MNINSKNLILSDCASIIFSFHKNIDKIREERKGLIKLEQLEEGLVQLMKIRLEEEQYVLVTFMMKIF